MKKMKTKGFTLIELIVVIAIIGIIAAILVPSLMGYVRMSRASKLNANAKTVFSGAQLAITDVSVAGGRAEPNCVYTGAADGVAYPASGTQQCRLHDYLGDNFTGYFLFETNSDGSGAVYALWSEQPLSPSDAGRLTLDEVKATVSTGKPIGCHPQALVSGT